MWKRDQAPQPSPEPTPKQPESATQPQDPRRDAAPADKAIANIGRSVIIKGELSGNENLFVEGQVEGKIDLRDHVLTIGPNGRIRAHIFAKAVVVQGEVIGNVTASERVTVRDTGSILGDIQTPRFALAEGARFQGKVDMQPEQPATSPKGGGKAADFLAKTHETLGTAATLDTKDGK